MYEGNSDGVDRKRSGSARCSSCLTKKNRRVSARKVQTTAAAAGADVWLSLSLSFRPPPRPPAVRQSREERRRARAKSGARTAMRGATGERRRRLGLLAPSGLEPGGKFRADGRATNPAGRPLRNPDSRVFFHETAEMKRDQPLGPASRVPISAAFLSNWPRLD